MPINGVSSSYFPAYTRRSATQSAAGGSTDVRLSNDGVARSDDRLLGHVNVLSRIQTTLPDGKSLSIFRFDLGQNGLSPSNAIPSDADKRDDYQMMDAFKQLTAYFNYERGPEDIDLEGTAAVDLSS